MGNGGTAVVVCLTLLAPALVTLISGTRALAAEADSMALEARLAKALHPTALEPGLVLHRVATLRAGGLDGEVEIWSDPAAGRYRAQYRIGPDHGSEGWDGTTGWRMDSAGRVRQLEGVGLADLRATAFLDSLAWATPAADADARAGVEVSLGTEPGSLCYRLGPDLAVTLDLDPASGLPQRARVSAPTPLRLRFGAWQSHQGWKLPGTVVTNLPATGIGRPSDDQRLTLTDATFEPPALTLFSPPAAGARDFQFPPHQPYSRSTLAVSGEAMTVMVMINGHGPYPFALDTGGVDAIDPALAAELGLQPVGRFLGRGTGEAPVEIGLTRLAELKIDEVTLSDQLVRVLPLGPGNGAAPPPYRGLLGYELFDRLVVTLDQDRGELTLADPETYVHRGDGVLVPIEMHGKVPAVKGEIDLIPGRFTLDTGQTNSLTLYRPFLARETIEHKYLPKMTTTVAWGLGGPIRAEVTRGGKLFLGEALVTDPVIYLSLQQAGAFADPAVAGNVGIGVFLRFNTTFDYTHRRVWLQRASRYSDGDSLHIVTVRQSATGLTVLSVLPGGPFADAGIQPGDEILSIDGADATSLDYHHLQRRFRGKPGTQVRLWVRSPGGLKTVTVTLGETV